MGTGNDLNISQSGYVAFDGTATFSGRTFQAGAGITLTNASGVAGNTTIALIGGNTGISSVNVDSASGAGTNPVLANGSGAITITGGQYVTGSFGTKVVDINSSAANTLAVLLQISTTNASSLVTKNGICHFNSSNFSVDSNGFTSIVSGGFAWVDVTTATQTIAIQTGYVTDHTNVTYTLPATAALGDTFIIVGKLGITTIAQNANQQILMASASSTVGINGSVAGTNVGDCATFICITAGASTVWRAKSFVGNWTVT